ncbi:MAG: EAL domain-containing protein [Ilumatobacteraceae bacterium]
MEPREVGGVPRAARRWAVVAVLVALRSDGDRVAARPGRVRRRGRGRPPPDIRPPSQPADLLQVLRVADVDLPPVAMRVRVAARRELDAVALAAAVPVFERADGWAAVVTDHAVHWWEPVTIPDGEPVWAGSPGAPTSSVAFPTAGVTSGRARHPDCRAVDDRRDRRLPRRSAVARCLTIFPLSPTRTEDTWHLLVRNGPSRCGRRAAPSSAHAAPDWSHHRRSPHRTRPPRCRRRPARLSPRRLRAARRPAALAAVCAGVVHLDLDRFHQVNTQWGTPRRSRARRARPPPRRLPPGQQRGHLHRRRLVRRCGCPTPTGGLTHAVAERMLEVIATPVELDNGEIVAVRASGGIAGRPITTSRSDLSNTRISPAGGRRPPRPAAWSGTSTLGEQAAPPASGGGVASLHRPRRTRLFVQPEIDLVRRPVGVEALVRWQHPTEGLLAPAAFLPDAEAAGPMNELGTWVLDAAIELAERWRSVRTDLPVRVG